MNRLSTIIGTIVLAFAYAGNVFAADVTITASGLTFSPANVTINAGDQVTWNGLDSIHNVAESDSLGSLVYNGTGFRSGEIGDFSTYQHTFSTPGVFYFICEPHAASGMRGSVTVNAVGMPPLSVAGYVILTSALVLFSLFVLKRSSTP
ncbi:MAG: plastocyanin/azurin family copper-binding protein [Candidatus Hydrogenedentota bacterium]